MKIGILTYHRSHNYGAFMQSYSFSHALDEEEDIDCEIINYNLKSEDEIYKKKKWKRPIYWPVYLKQEYMFRNVQKFQLLSQPLIINNDYQAVLEDVGQKYDVIIVGSDEIWRIGSRGFPNIYWLPGKYNFTKMSYAASGRMPVQKLTSEQVELMKHFYSDFRYIGVRDQATQQMIKGISRDFHVYKNCDPAFLYKGYRPKKTLKEHICKQWELNSHKYLIAVMYDRTDVIYKLRHLLGNEFEFICIARPMWNANKNLCAVTPFEWVDIIGGVDFLVTSYFHGMLFAINQNTPFIAIDRRAERNSIYTSKLYNFLSAAKLEDRYYISKELDTDRWIAMSKMVKRDAVSKDISFNHIVKEQRTMFDEFKKQLKELEVNG